MGVLRKPLVVGSDGLPAQLPPGDDLDATISGTITKTMASGSASTIPLGGVVFQTPGVATVGLADATGDWDVVGMAYQAIAVGNSGSIALSGIVVASTGSGVGSWDAVCDQSISSGLAIGSRYFLSLVNPGNITTVVPTSVGQAVVYIGIALSATELLLAPPFTPIKL